MTEAGLALCCVTRFVAQIEAMLSQPSGKKHKRPMTSVTSRIGHSVPTMRCVVGVAAPLPARHALPTHIDMAITDQCKAADCDTGLACQFVWRASVL